MTATQADKIFDFIAKGAGLRLPVGDVARAGLLKLPLPLRSKRRETTKSKILSGLEKLSPNPIPKSSILLNQLTESSKNDNLLKGKDYFIKEEILK